MDSDPNEPVDVCTVGSPFEAETIAAFLKDCGFHANATTIVASVLQWSGGVNNNGTVQVPRSELVKAREALAEMKEEAKSINWTQVLEVQSDQSDQSRVQPLAICEYCGANREGINLDASCRTCGKTPPPPPSGSDRAQVRTKLILYLGLFVIGLPLLTAVLLAIARRLLRI